MRVLVACECSGMVRDAFIEEGHDAWSCDLQPSDNGGPHIQWDVRRLLDEGWDLMIAHPPCTHLSVSGAGWFHKKKARQQAALDFVLELLNAPIPQICIENPVSILSTVLRQPDQIIQPWQFGDEAQKTTCLWLKNLPRLRPTKIVGKGEFVHFKTGAVLMPKWLHDAYGKKDRSKIRSRTFPGIAMAMARQWNRPNYRRGFGIYVPFTMRRPDGR